MGILTVRYGTRLRLCAPGLAVEGLSMRAPFNACIVHLPHAAQSSGVAMRAYVR